MADTTTAAPPANVYTEAQHFALLESAVERETAAIAAEKSALETQVQTLESEKAALATELSEAKSRIDVLESDKATAEAAAETARKELEDYKAEIARKEQIEGLRSQRAERVKAANGNLTDAYFTPERTTRWAEMSDEDFEALVSEMTEFAAAAKPAQQTESSTTTTEQAARETAAFSGGQTPEVEGSSTDSTVGMFLAKRRASGF